MIKKLILPSQHCPSGPDNLEVAKHEQGSQDSADDTDHSRWNQSQHIHIDALNAISGNTYLNIFSSFERVHILLQIRLLTFKFTFPSPTLNKMYRSVRKRPKDPSHENPLKAESSTSTKNRPFCKILQCYQLLHCTFTCCKSADHAAKEDLPAQF